MRVREAYVNANQGGDFGKADRWGITRLWFEHNDPRSPVATSHSGRVGIKMNGAGAEVAVAMNRALKDHGFGSSTSPGSCGAAFDPEPFHPADVVELLQKWRSIRKTRYTQLWVPPWQEGAFSPELVDAINRDPNLLLVIQGYMSLPAADGKIDDLYPADITEAIDRAAAVGVERIRMQKFIGVKGSTVGVEIPYGWTGLLWTFDQLPASPPGPL